MEPVSSIVTITGLVVKGLELAHKRREGKLNKEEAQVLYCRIYSSLLWEVYQNLERCKGIVNMAQKNKLSAGILSFFVRDSLFSDFCIMCPEPLTISGLNQIYGAFERIHHWQRVTIDLSSKSAEFIKGFASDLFEDKKMHIKYNDLLDVLKNLRSDVQVPPKFKIS